MSHDDKGGEKKSMGDEDNDDSVAGKVHVKTYGVPEGEAGEWNEQHEDEHVRNLYKADKLMEDVLYRQNMYMISSQHYSHLNK